VDSSHDGESWDFDASLNVRDMASVTEHCSNIRASDPGPYWVETANLVMEYFVLQAGPDYNETLRQGFVAWLKRSPGNRKQYREGSDMKRAALVDWFLRLVR
jgi:hypothetical protein